MNETTHYTTDDSPQRSSGYFYFVGILQIGAGILSVLFSLFGFLQIRLAETWGIIDSDQIVHSFASRGSNGWTDFVAGYVSFHLAFGWIFGILLILAGIFSMQMRYRRFVWISAIINLFNFPHGTTAALMVWHGLHSPQSSTFDDMNGR